MTTLTRPSVKTPHLPPMPPPRSVVDWFTDPANQVADWAAVDAWRAAHRTA